jgi:hypothetical protein
MGRLPRDYRDDADYRRALREESDKLREVLQWLELKSDILLDRAKEIAERTHHLTEILRQNRQN